MKLVFFLHDFIRTYDMPLFALIAGYFLKISLMKHGVINVIIRKITQILIPVVIWCSIWSIIYSVFSHQLYITITKFWFLWAIFFNSLLISVAHYVRVKLNCFVSVIFLFLITVITHLGFLEFWHVGFLIVPMALGYFYKDISYLINRIVDSMIIKIVIGATFIFLICFWDKEYNIWNAGLRISSFNSILVIAFRGIIGILGSITMLCVFKTLYSLTSGDNRALNSIFKGIIDVGKNTFSIYILQTFIVENLFGKFVEYLIIFLGFNIFIYNTKLLSFIIAPLFSIIFVIIIYWTQHLIKKIPFVGKVFFGFSLQRTTIKS